MRFMILVDYTTLHILETIIVQWREPEKTKQPGFHGLREGFWTLLIWGPNSTFTFQLLMKSTKILNLGSENGQLFTKLIDIWWWHASSRNLHCSPTGHQQFFMNLAICFIVFEGFPWDPYVFVWIKTMFSRSPWHGSGTSGLSLMWNMFRVEDMSWWLATSPWNNGA